MRILCILNLCAKDFNTKMDCFIDMLPVGELLTIFEYLDAKTLKNAALVCKKWYQNSIY